MRKKSPRRPRPRKEARPTALTRLTKQKAVRAWAWKWNDSEFPDLKIIRVNKDDIGEVRRCPGYGQVVEIEIREVPRPRTRRRSR